MSRADAEIRYSIKNLYFHLISEKLFEFFKKIKLIDDKTLITNPVINKIFYEKAVKLNENSGVDFHFENDSEKWWAHHFHQNEMIIDIELSAFDNFNKSVSIAEFDYNTGIMFINQALKFYMEEYGIENKLNIKLRINLNYKNKCIHYTTYSYNHAYQVEEKHNSFQFNDKIAIKNLYQFYFNYKNLYDTNGRRTGLSTANIYRSILERIFSEERTIIFTAPHKYDYGMFQDIFHFTELFGDKLPNFFTIEKGCNLILRRKDNKNMPSSKYFISNLEESIKTNYFEI